MKKKIIIFLIVFGLFVSNITQASAGCDIVWTGDLSGSTPTNETSRTQEAASQTLEAISTISPSETGYYRSCDSSSCSEGWYIYVPGLGPYGEAYEAFTDGFWSHISYSRYCPPDGICADGSGNWDVICETLINLSSFAAVPKNGKVIIKWTTKSEIDNAGFNLYRAESEKGEYIKINDALIPAQGSSTQGSSYQFIDNNVQNRKIYFYKLEDIDLNGTLTMHGPVSATPRWFLGILGK